jgi:hypothetical protein
MSECKNEWFVIGVTTKKGFYGGGNLLFLPSLPSTLDSQAVGTMTAGMTLRQLEAQMTSELALDNTRAH